MSGGGDLGLAVAGKCQASTRADLTGQLLCAMQVLEIDKDASGEVCVRLLTPAAPAGAVSAWAPDSEQLRPCCLV